ncbi:MAG TPA: DUF2191 domain-containing protein [Terriglobia bacterium]|nr:DUF2191 domain-containing protein [Terriglobia bacterium]
MAFLFLDILMLLIQHQDVRTTLTLDDDVATKLRAEARHSGEPFKQVVNRVLRAGLFSQKQFKSLPPFKIKPRNMGLRPGVNLDDVWGLIDLIDQSDRRR